MSSAGTPSQNTIKKFLYFPNPKILDHFFWFKTIKEYSYRSIDGNSDHRIKFIEMVNSENITKNINEEEYLQWKLECGKRIDRAFNLLNIARLKNVIIYNIIEACQKVKVSEFRLHVRCKHGKITKPTINDFQRPKYIEKSCSCVSIWKRKDMKLEVDDSSEWKLIHEIKHPMAEKYNIKVISPIYMVSTDGRVKNLVGNFIDQPSISGKYTRINLKANGRGNKGIFVHILVACAFIPLPENATEIDKLSVDHIDRNKDNNHKDNLRWATPSEQALNREPMIRPGNLWVCESGVYFSEEDFETYCPDKSTVKIIPHVNFHDRIRDEEDINFVDEHWMYVAHENKHYFVSSMGRAYYDSFHKRTFGQLDDNGYMKFQSCRLHRLIAFAFLRKELNDKIKTSGLTQDQLHVNHKDGRKCNNKLSNLEWMTPSENTLHGKQLNRCR